jgi:hypothetical protein
MRTIENEAIMILSDIKREAQPSLNKRFILYEFIGEVVFKINFV